jgi:hypothetical protein
MVCNNKNIIFIFAKIKIMKYLVMVAFSLMLLQANAQNKTATSNDYKTGVGLRIWNGAGVSLKTFFAENQAADITAFFGSGQQRITAMYEKHGDLSTEGNLKWYFGAGGNVAFVKVASVKKTIVGVNGVVGVDYKFKAMPLNLSLDWQPGFQFQTGYGYVGDWFSLAVRYTL